MLVLILSLLPKEDANSRMQETFLSLSLIVPLLPLKND